MDAATCLLQDLSKQNKVLKQKEVKSSAMISELDAEVVGLTAEKEKVCKQIDALNHLMSTLVTVG